jgi:signal transduction histidine kinase
LSFVAPQKVLFRYKLDGHDKSWQEAGTRRQAFYTDLPPGHYTFHVKACNNSGVWNDSGAALNLDIPPAWYQTVWFQLATAAAAVCLLWLIVFSRIRATEREVGFRFEAQMTERMRIARELHDTLLQSLQGVILSFSNFSSRVRAADEEDLSNLSQEMDGALDRAEELLLSGRDRIRDLRSEQVVAKTMETELHSLVRGAECKSGVKIDVRIAGKPRDLKALVQDEVLWIMREALANACRHSGATQIQLQVWYSRSGIRCAVQDNGQGIEDKALVAKRPGHFGVVGMRERAERIGGRLTIRSFAGMGTTIALSVPARIAHE